ncbi:MAG: transglutaminase domain-containing protein [Acidovorax sp.]|nr:transglutaminase domain-containing protein [Acidovorax sp.]
MRHTQGPRHPDAGTDHGNDSNGNGNHRMHRPAGWFKRSVVWLIAASIINGLGLPLVHAQIAQRNQQAAQQRQQGGPAERYANTLEQLHGALTANPNARARNVVPYLPAVETLQQQAWELAEEWRELHATWEAAGGVDGAILQRQFEQEKAFEARHGELVERLKAVKAHADDEAALQALKNFVDAEKPTRTHLPINLNKLPWRVETARLQEPATTDAELDLKTGVATAAAQASPLGTAKSATAPTPADLADTVDARQTPPIKALAQTLGHNPHKIYQWVHDNIHYVPTHGSVQGAQDTLDKKAGNAFDTASLLVALLRASGIPARYVVGSVHIPAAQAMNWVGGAKTTDAAQQLWGQGGVPNTALVSGGKVTTLRIEHPWVEALIQYQPGRGARHIAGQSAPDTWVPMDASYKQYTFTEGMDLATAVPLDAQALLDAASQGATANEAEGWVQHLNTTALQSQLASYQSRLKTYIDSRNGGQSTVGDVLGMRQAKIDPLPYLAGTLPYTIKARSQQFSDIPNSRRAQFKYEIYADQRAAAWGDSPLLSWQAPTAELAGKKVTIAWVAAGAADQRAIEALIPKGQQLDPSRLPRGLSSSISLRPEIRLDGQTVATGPAMRAGSEPVGVGAFTRYGGQDWDETQDQLIAGQQTALGLSIQGISRAQMQTLEMRIKQNKAQLEQALAAQESQRETFLQGMTGEGLAGDLLTATIWSYFASLQSHGAIAGGQAGVFDRPALSYGLFHAQVRPNKLYGIVTTGITFQGLNIDIGHLRHIRWVKDDDPQSAINAKPELTANGKSAAQNRWIAYNKMRGQYASAMEHAVPEQYWVDKSQCRYVDGNGQVQNPTKMDCVQGISAVKAIAIAQAEGQRIYTINQQNAATALSNLPVGGSVGAEIRAAVEAGKEVTVHERAISAKGWTGYGYIITDSETGAGGYLIEGKGNGGWLAGFASGAILGLIMVAFAGVAISGAMGVFAVGILLLVIAVLLVPFVALMALMYENGNEEWRSCFWGGFGIGLSVSTYSLAGALAKVVQMIGLAMGIAIPSNAATQCF